MPTYEYACSGCGNAWEEMQKITEAPIEVCPKCHAKTAKRQISGGNFILKGGGWYADLYSSAKPGKSESKGESSSSSTSTSTSTSNTSSTSNGTSTSTSTSTTPSTSTPAPAAK